VSIPKESTRKAKTLGGPPRRSGEIRRNEEAVARRRRRPRSDLAPVKQPGGKVVTAFAFTGDHDPANAHSNTSSSNGQGAQPMRALPGGRQGGSVTRLGAQGQGQMLKGQLAMLTAGWKEPPHGLV